ncbi:ClpX C4-type zinc finger protein [Microlunatus capsulatus]
MAQVVAGPGSCICDECVALCVQIMAGPRRPPAAEPEVPRWSTMTDEALLDRLPLVAAAARQVEDALAGWVAECRRRGASWARVGTALQMSRQAAWERFERTR